MQCGFQSVDGKDCCDDTISSSFFFFLNFVLIFFNVILPQIGESCGPKAVFVVTQSTLLKSVNFLNFFTGFKHALATIPLVLNLLSDLFDAFFDFVWIISVLARTIAFGLTVDTPFAVVMAPPLPPIPVFNVLCV